MDSRSRIPFLLLILAQAAHSLEEYLFRLFDVLAPARYVSGLFGIDRADGFVAINSALVAFGVGLVEMLRSGASAGAGSRG